MSRSALSSPPPLSSMRLAARPVREGESLADIAQKLFGDPRLATLLADLNPEYAKQPDHLPKGAKLRVPSREDARRWAASLGSPLAGPLQAGHGTRAQRRWGAFAQKQSTRRGEAGDVVKLALSPDFAALVEQVQSMDTVGRGLELWKEVEGIGEQALQLGLGAQKSDALNAAVDKTLARDALGEAIDMHLLDFSARFGAKILQRCRQAIAATLQKPERLSRLLIGIVRLDEDQAQALLAAMAVPATLRQQLLGGRAALKTLRKTLLAAAASPGAHKKQIKDLARRVGLGPQDKVLQKLLRKLPSSAAARDRLLVLLAGLGAAQEAVATKLQSLAAVMHKIEGQFGNGVERSAQAPKIAQLIVKLDEFFPILQQELQISEQDSPIAMSLQRLLDQAPGRPDPMIQLACALPAAMGPALLDTDAAALERGLAPVLKRLRGQSAQKPRQAELKAMQSVDLLARAEAAQAQASEQLSLAKEVGESAALLAEAELPQGDSSAMQHKRSDRFYQNFSMSAANSEQLDPDDLRRDVLDYLQQAAELIPLARRQARGMIKIVQRPEFFSEFLRALPGKPPSIGARRMNPQGLALMLAARLVQSDLARLRDPAELAQGCATWIGRSGGQGLAACARSLKIR